MSITDADGRILALRAGLVLGGNGAWQAESVGGTCFRARTRARAIGALVAHAAASRAWLSALDATA